MTLHFVLQVSHLGLKQQLLLRNRLDLGVVGPHNLLLLSKELLYLRLGLLEVLLEQGELAGPALEKALVLLYLIFQTLLFFLQLALFLNQQFLVGVDVVHLGLVLFDFALVLFQLGLRLLDLEVYLVHLLRDVGVFTLHLLLLRIAIQKLLLALLLALLAFPPLLGHSLEVVGVDHVV